MSHGMTFSQWKKMWGVKTPQKSRRARTYAVSARQVEKNSASRRLGCWIVGIFVLSGLIGAGLGLNPAGVLVGIVVGIVLHRFWLSK